jgi:hypothetical protein
MRGGFAFRTARLMGHNEGFSSGLEQVHNQPTGAARQDSERASAVDSLNARPL